MTTRTLALLAVAISAAVTAAVRWLLSTRVEGRVPPFPCTLELLVKFVPVSASVKAGAPATAELGLGLVSVGTGTGVGVGVGVGEDVGTGMSGQLKVGHGVGVGAGSQRMPQVCAVTAGSLTTREVMRAARSTATARAVTITQRAIPSAL